MVTATVEDSASGVSDALAERDVVGIAALALIGAGGVFLGREVADQVLPYLNMNVQDPGTTGLAASALAQVIAALALGMAALRFDGLVSTGAGVAAFGVLVSAGFDVVDMVQSENPLGGGNGGNGESSSTPVSNGTATPSSSPSGSPPVRRAAPAGGGSNFR